MMLGDSRGSAKFFEGSNDVNGKGLEGRSPFRGEPAILGVGAFLTKGTGFPDQAKGFIIPVQKEGPLQTDGPLPGTNLPQALLVIIFIKLREMLCADQKKCQGIF